MEKARELWHKYGFIASFLAILASTIASLNRLSVDNHLSLLKILGAVAIVSGWIGLLVWGFFRIRRLRESDRRLTRLTAALSKLFEKSRHLREHVARGGLEQYRNSVEREIGQTVSETPTDVAVRVGLEGLQNVSWTNRHSFIATGASRLLGDLRESLEELTGMRDFTCSTLFTNLGEVEASNTMPTELGMRIPLLMVPEKELPPERVRPECRHLAMGFSLAATALRKPASRMVGRLSELGTTDHHNVEWPNMDKYIQSIAVCPILSDSRPLGVLQVDCPRPSGLPPETEAMIACTANLLAVLFEIAGFTRELFCELLQKDATHALELASLRNQYEQKMQAHSSVAAREIKIRDERIAELARLAEPVKEE